MSDPRCYTWAHKLIQHVMNSHLISIFCLFEVSKRALFFRSVHVKRTRSSSVVFLIRSCFVFCVCVLYLLFIKITFTILFVFVYSVVCNKTMLHSTIHLTLKPNLFCFAPCASIFCHNSYLFTTKYFVNKIIA